MYVSALSSGEKRVLWEDICWNLDIYVAGATMATPGALYFYQLNWDEFWCRSLAMLWQSQNDRPDVEAPPQRERE